MKSWFTFLVNGMKIGVWANSTSEGYELLRKEYGDAKIECLGMYVKDVGTKPDKFNYIGMSLMDHMIESGSLKMMANLSK